MEYGYEIVWNMGRGGTRDVLLLKNWGWNRPGSHALEEIDPDEPVNIEMFGAINFIHAAPQSFWLKEIAPSNI